MSDAANAGGFPFRTLLRDGLYVAVLCVVCAVIITIVGGNPQSLGVNLLFSACIGGIAFLLIDGARLYLWGSAERTAPLPFFAIVLVSVPVAQLTGGMLASALLGYQTPHLGKLMAGGSNGMLLFTLIMTVAATVFFYNREHLMRARADAAQEKARAELVARQALQAQLQLLQAQVEPHMLFNTLANLQGLIDIDPQRAQHMLEQLIQYLRATLSSSRADATTLAQEFSLMSAYLGLMSVRMGQRLTFALDLPPALRDAKLPPMLLQPLVENAFIHGLEPKIDGGHLAVSAAEVDGRLVLIVADSGLGLDAPSAKAGTHLGVANTRERLRALYGGDAALTLDPNTPCGAIARLTLPLERA